MKNIILIVLTILFSGVSVFFRKLAIDCKMHPYQIQVVACILYASLIPIWIFLLSKNESSVTYAPNGVFYSVLCLAFYVLSAVILGIIFKTTTSVGAVSAIVATNPLITLALSVLFLGEEITLKKVIGCIVIVSGIGLIK